MSNGTGGPVPGDRRRPDWLQKKRNLSNEVMLTRARLQGFGLHTVCEEARCPNLGECFSQGVATFMILGDRCTRNCRFCAVDHHHPLPVDASEGERISEYVHTAALRYVVITSVTRDDLADGGASHFARVVRQIRASLPDLLIELLVPDFKGDEDAVKATTRLPVAVLGHNMETVRSLYPKARHGADYDRSLQLLRRAKHYGPGSLKTKSGIMVGLGETDHELSVLFEDLSRCRLDILTIGQYLRPSNGHLPVQRYCRPEELDELATEAKRRGIGTVMAGPYVRSSYLADRAYAETAATELHSS